MSPEQHFQRLTDFLSRYDGLALLCQASMTYLFTPEGTFHSESDDVQIWGRRLEFAAGYYATRTPNPSGGLRVTGTTLEEFKTLIDDYYLSIDIDGISRARDGSHEAFSVESARIHSMHVRGDAYPHQLEEYARELYGEHDEWLLEKLGFTISDAYAVANGMAWALNERFNLLSKSTEAEAEAIIQHDRSWIEAGMSEIDVKRSAQIQLFFGRAKEHYQFSVEDIVKCSHLPHERCTAVLARLSQKPPFQNPLFPNTFEDAKRAPWDYNTLSERPLITDGQNYWLIVPHLFRQNLYYTFYFDLMGDRSYKPLFEKSRGQYLERKVAEYLRRIFPDSAVLLNPDYPDGNEFSDVLVLHDGKIIIVQCKGKALTRQAHIGLSADAIRSDIQKAVKDAVDQGVRCRKYLEANNKASLVYRGTPFSIDMTMVTQIEIVAVTLMPLHTMATRIREVEKDLGMPHSEFSGWAVALGDLDIVTDICHSPARFLQYIRRRLLLEEGDIRVHGDEMDLLGFFLTQGLWMKDERFAETDILGISGLSNTIDEYVFRRWDCNETLDKPEIERPDGFYALIEGIEKLDQFHRTDCAIIVLELSSNASEKLMHVVKLTKQKTREDGKSHSMSLQGEEGEPGISFQAFPADTDPTFVSQRAQGFGIIKKYSEKLDMWVALCWIQNEKSQVDGAFWLNFPWVHQEQLEEAARKLRADRSAHV